MADCDSLFSPVLAANSFEAGRLIGGLFVLLLQGLGIAKCIQLMRRERTSSLCVLSLLLVLAGWFFSSLMSLGEKMLEWPRVVTMVSAVLVVLVLLGAVVVAIVGLARYDKHRLVQGRSQAVWAIVLACVFMLAFLGGAIMAIRRNGLAWGASTPAKRVEFERFNCALEPPPGWLALPADSPVKAPGSQATFRKASADIYMTFIPEELGGSMDLATYTEMTTSRLAVMGTVKSQESEDLSLGGLEFRHVSSSVIWNQGGLALQYEHWVAAQGGWFWQVVLWGPGADAAQVRAEGRKFAAGFRMLDPKRKSMSGGTWKDVSRPALGYATGFEGTGWGEAPQSAKDNLPLADSMAVHGVDYVGVAPLHFADGPPDLEILSEALLALLQFEVPVPADKIRTAPFPSPLGAGLEMQTERELEGRRYSYVFRFVRGKTHAWVVMGWALHSKGDMERVRKAMDSVVLQEPAGPVPEQSENLRTQTAHLLNQVGIAHYSRKNFKAAARWFGQAYAYRSPDATVLGNLVDALDGDGQAQEALKTLELHGKQFTKAWKLQAQRANLLLATGQADAGQAQFLAMIEGGFKEEPALLAWLDALVSNDRQDLAEQAATAWNARQPSSKTRRWQVEVIASGGDFKRAIALLEPLVEESPQEEVSVCRLAELYNEDAQYSRAAELMEKFLEGGRSSARALQCLGWSQMGRKWYREAKASFERAARLMPEDEGLQAALRRASAFLGEGNNSDTKQPLEPVLAPEKLTAELASIKAPPDLSEGASGLVILRSTGYYFEKGKPARRTLWRRFKLLDQNAVNACSTMEYEFDPLSERIFVNQLTVRDAAGKVLADGPPESAYVSDPEEAMASHRKVLHVQVPGLKVGCEVEVQVTIAGRSPAEEFEFERHLFGVGWPCAADVVFVSGDVARLKTVLSQGSRVKALKGEKWAGWLASAMRPVENEPFATFIEMRIPLLVLGAAEESWMVKGDEYLKDIADRLKPDETVSKLAAEICEGAKSEREKIARIARHVQKALHYKALEFGVRARRPDSPETVLRQGFGDCKDHSLLLHQLLGAAGVESHLCLVNTEHLVHPELPSLEQFNHMVVHVPALGPAWLMDPTDKSLALEKFPADALWHSHGLVLAPGKSRLIAPPPAPAEGSATVESRRTVTPSGSDWRVEETVLLHGYYGAWMRTSFDGLTAADQTRKAQGILAGLGSAEVQEFRFENLENLAEPACLKMAYLVRNAVAQGQGKASGVLPAFWERDYLKLPFVPKRTTPFQFRYPFRFHSETNATFPAKADLEVLSQKSRGKQTDWELKAGPRGLVFDFQARPFEGAADHYGSFYESWELALRAWNTPVRWAAP